MKKIPTLIITILMILNLCACSENADKTAQTVALQETTAPTVAQDKAENSGENIIGTWVCDDISDECYFIFDEKGDAYAKWGTCTVYGYYDYYTDEDIYDIDVPNFLYNEYKATFSGDEMKLESEDSSFSFEKASMPEITIKAPENLKADAKLVGDWQSENSYECYRFNKDNTAVITDIMSESTVDCKYSCENGTVTLYYMSSDTKDGSRDIDYKISGEKLILGELTYEKVGE